VLEQLSCPIVHFLPDAQQAKEVVEQSGGQLTPRLEVVSLLHKRERGSIATESPPPAYFTPDIGYSSLNILDILTGK